MMIAIFFWWIGLSIVVAVAADTRDRSPIAWFIYAIIFSPLLGGLLLLALLDIGVREGKEWTQPSNAALARPLNQPARPRLEGLAPPRRPGARAPNRFAGSPSWRWR